MNESRRTYQYQTAVFENRELHAKPNEILPHEGEWVIQERKSANKPWRNIEGPFQKEPEV